MAVAIVRLVSPYGAAGQATSRCVSSPSNSGAAQPAVLVENKPGAGTRVANELSRAPAADGYTFLYAAAPFATLKPCFEKLNYTQDLQPVPRPDGAVFLV